MRRTGTPAKRQRAAAGITRGRFFAPECPPPNGQLCRSSGLESTLNSFAEEVPRECCAFLECGGLSAAFTEVSRPVSVACGRQVYFAEPHTSIESLPPWRPSKNSSHQARKTQLPRYRRSKIS